MPSVTRIEKIFKILKKANPNPTTELQYQSPFELLIAVILSAQATDKGVNLATAKLFPVANTAEEIFDLGEAGLKEYIKTIGLYNAKAKNIIKTCEILLKKHCGEVPNNRQALEALPGVGRKTANVLLNTLFGENTVAVDTHIFRVAHRLGLSKGKTPEKVEQDLMHIIPMKYLKDAHHWLVLHGRYICQAKKPKCEICPLTQLCEYYQSYFLSETKAKA
ncbi:MAG: nth [Gammaproteobacteria bacterium]|jgi:endonuclease-3|nr:nth [Gammaproteobacteria bacterium]